MKVGKKNCKEAKVMMGPDERKRPDYKKQSWKARADEQW